jgi:hypothetical protein
MSTLLLDDATSKETTAAPANNDDVVHVEADAVALGQVLVEMVPVFGSTFDLRRWQKDALSMIMAAR